MHFAAINPAAFGLAALFVLQGVLFSVAAARGTLRFFFRGWLLLRFEAAFGLVPGLLLSALCYSAYHIAYGMSTGETTVVAARRSRSHAPHNT
jgi:membrane protease YdiL (CAAX protease family)